ncbi:MFS transporter [Exophiala viscosa]|uniref:MFS transporter n=1 Tax=Exophiala viscosa TaxID=2486360 RepID=UPI0021969005|nr:MFS transporter [Exophiala viscosa]
MDHEDAFAEEAQEEALLSEASTTDLGIETQYSMREDDEDEDESSPLVSPRRRRPQKTPYSRASASYQRAIDEPWSGAHGSHDLPWYKKPSIFWLLPAFFPFCIAFGGIIVPKTYLILDLICQDYLSDRAAKDPTFTFTPVLLGSENPQCRDPNVQARVATFNLEANLLSGIFSAIISPHLGSLSDRIGRKKIIVCASFGALGAEIITIIVGKNEGRVSVYWILLGALFDGLCGSFTTAMALAFAYAADCSPPERRNVAFGYFHGTLFAGIALGPILAGYLIKLSGTVLIVFYVALGCHLFYILFISLVVPESLSKERQMIAKEKRRLAKAESPPKHWFTELRNYNLFKPLWVLRPTGPGTSSKLRQNLFVLAAIDTMMFGVAMGTMQIIIIFAEFRFGWTAVDSSMFLSAVNVCRVTGLLLLLPILTRIFRGPTQAQSQSSGHKGADMLDINIIRGSIVFDLLGYIGYALTPSGAIMVISGMVASLGGIGSPTLQSALTKHIPADRTGQVLGASGLLHALARVVAPTIFNLIYRQTVGVYAGTVFICLASVFVVVFAFSWFLRPNVYLHEGSNVDSDENEVDEQHP